MTDYFNCPGCGFELPGTAELTEDCFFCGWKFPERAARVATASTTGLKTAVISVTGDTSNNHKGRYEKARLTILDWHNGESYRKMAKRLGVKKKKIESVASALCAVANGNENQPAVLVLLDLEPKTAPAPVCNNPDCEGYGQPHVFDCQTQQVTPKPNGRKGKARKQYHYFKCRPDNPEQAARQVEKHMPGYKLVKEG